MRKKGTTISWISFSHHLEKVDMGSDLYTVLVADVFAKPVYRDRDSRAHILGSGRQGVFILSISAARGKSTVLCTLLEKP